MLLMTFRQVLKLFLFLLCGFLLRRRSVVPVSTAGTLSLLEVNLILPCLTFLTFAQNFTLAKLSADLPLVAASLISCGLTFAAGTWIGRHLDPDRYRQNVCIYSLNVPNTGYVGTPLVLGLFGSETLMRMSIFCLPLSVYTYAVGYRLLLDRKGNVLRSLLCPPMAAMYLGALFGMLKIPLPGLVTEVLSDCGACMGPLAMVLTGCMIAEFHLGDILRDPLLYKTVAIRMIAIPAVLLTASRLLGVPRDILCILAAVFTMPTGLNTVVFPSSAGKDCRLGAGMACISNVLAILSIPLFFSIFL